MDILTYKTNPININNHHPQRRMINRITPQTVSQLRPIESNAPTITNPQIYNSFVRPNNFVTTAPPAIARPNNFPQTQPHEAMNLQNIGINLVTNPTPTAPNHTVNRARVVEALRKLIASMKK
ncbi:predicted protein [Naegleria gruberi]|uniref:Predicted protein n=1 Tax=Naegleria gruberi TaxID=5762 RepID=D2W6L5_NAEGR|nr:uncharacterized protein NAEGRDRAFT_54996 [Naegleria gruberi]EFC35286.1 predicted protein [Naegleria gruberi]|eukprot:XP_002668030.1 predicted protein [Naegleria gruberi strain NEG-M]